MEFHVQPRLGTRVGIGAIVWLALMDILVIWIATQVPVSIITFGLALFVLVTLPVIALVIYWLWGLRRAGISLDRNSLTIQWGAVRQVIPMASINQVLHGSEIAGRMRRPRSVHWPGHWIGQAQVDDIGAVLFYAAGSLDDQLIIVTPGLGYAITPDNIPAFVEAFEQRKKMGPTQEVAQVSIQPSIMSWPLWTDRVALGLVAGAVAACLLLFGFVCLRFPDLAPRIALHFAAGGDPDRFGERAQVFLLPLIGLLALAVNLTLGLPIYLRDKLGGYLLWAGALVVQVLAWVAALGILS